MTDCKGCDHAHETSERLVRIETKLDDLIPSIKKTTEDHEKRLVDVQGEIKKAHGMIYILSGVFAAALSWFETRK